MTDKHTSPGLKPVFEKAASSSFKGTSQDYNNLVWIFALAGDSLDGRTVIGQGIAYAHFSEAYNYLKTNQSRALEIAHPVFVPPASFRAINEERRDEEYSNAIMDWAATPQSNPPSFEDKQFNRAKVVGEVLDFQDFLIARSYLTATKSRHQPKP